MLRGIYGNDDLTKRTKMYEKCGAWSSPDTIVTPIDHRDWSKGYIVSEGDPELIHPYTDYSNAMEFFANFGQMSIPFMEDFSI